MFPTMSLQILGTCDVKKEIAELEYKANCLGKIIEVKKNFFFGEEHIID